MKRFPSRIKNQGPSLFKRTIKSYSKREKWISAVMIVLVALSGWKILSGNWEGRTLTSVVSGGHNYNEGMVGEVVRLNPVYADLNEVDRDITSLLFDGLSIYDPAQRKVVENIATHTLDESKTLYTFVLHEGMTWHDGTPVTTDDVYFTYHDVIQHPEFENPVLKSSFDGVTIEKIDDQTITMQLNEPNSFFFTQLTVGILPQHLLKDIPVSDLDSAEFNQFPVGNGPYKMVSAYEKQDDGSSQVQLAYNENYWKGETPDITEIQFFTFPTFEELIASMGQLHGTARVPQYRLEEINEERLTAYEYSLPQYTALFMDTDNDELVKQKIRLAIQKAIDKEAILEAIGYDQKIDTPLMELEQEEWIYQPNPEEAAGALFDSGWELDKETGLRFNEDGQVLSFALVRRSYPNNEKQEEVTRITAEMIKEQLEAVGIVVTIESYENEVFQQKVTDRDYDLLLYGQSLGYNLDTYSYWHSSQANQSGLNLSNYTNAKADFNIEAIRNTFGGEEEDRQEYLQSLAEIIKNDVPAVFLYTPSYYFLSDSRIQGIQTDHLLFPQDRFANILEWQVM